MPGFGPDDNIDFDVIGYGFSVGNFNGPQPTIKQAFDVQGADPVGLVTQVGNATGQIIPADPGRRGIIFVNPGTVTIWVLPMPGPVLQGQGIPIPPNGGQVQFPPEPSDLVDWTCGWCAVAQSGTQNPLVMLVY